MDANQRKFDIVMAWSVDRPGRSLRDLVGFLSELHGSIDLFLHQQGLDTTTPAGKAMVQVMGVFAEFERSMIQERVRAWLGRAKDEGKQLGRPADSSRVGKNKSLPLSGRPVVQRADVDTTSSKRLVEKRGPPIVDTAPEGFPVKSPAPQREIGEILPQPVRSVRSSKRTQCEFQSLL